MIRYGNGWVPRASRPNYGDVGQFLPRFKEMAQGAGRDPASLPVTLFRVPEGPDLSRRHSHLCHGRRRP